MDFAQIVVESQKATRVSSISNHRRTKRSHALQPPFGAEKKILQANASLPNPVPLMMVISRAQEPRATHPPVPPSHLLRFPYVRDGLVPLDERKRKHLESVDGDFSHSAMAPGGGGRKRKRGKFLGKKRPPPMFWRPNPTWGGKSLGYAMGYPSSWAAYEDDCDPLVKPRYRRDTMRKAVFAS